MFNGIGFLVNVIMDNFLEFVEIRVNMMVCKGFGLFSLDKGMYYLSLLVSVCFI